MTKDYFEHGDLYWINLEPFASKYILMKIIDYDYICPTADHSKYVYVYDFFVDDPSADIPPREERELYMLPFNFREFYMMKVEALHYIKPEQVLSSEIVYAFSLYKGSLGDKEKWIINSENAHFSYEKEYPIQDIYMLDYDSLYSDYEIFGKVIHDYLINENISFNDFPIEENEKFGIDNYIYSPTKAYEMFQYSRKGEVLDRPTYKSIKGKGIAIFTDPEWDSNYPKFKGATKSMYVIEKEDYGYEFGFRSGIIGMYSMLKPHFEKLGVFVSGGSMVSLLLSFIYGDNDYLNNIDVDQVKVINKTHKDFVITFGSEKDNLTVMEFYKDEILNPEKIEYYMGYMNRTVLDLYYTASTPPHLGKLIRHATEESFLDILDRYRMAKDEKDYFGVTISFEELSDHLGKIVNTDMLEVITSTIMQKKYKVTDFHTLKSEYYFDLYCQQDDINLKLYRYLKRSFKTLETYEKMLKTLKLDV
jgi:hypothetical protein